jgi:hypothetical protein
LNTIYDGWIARVEALLAARRTGVYRAFDDASAVQRRRAALEAHNRLVREMEVLRAKAGRERQMNRRVDLNMQIQRLQAALAEQLSDL